jgi:isopentenyl phosphate kinase
MQAVPIIIKLGGSVITDKQSGKPIVRIRYAKRLAREIARAGFKETNRSRSPLILLYGGGSFGHPLAHKHQLSGRILSVGALVGAAQATSSMRRLGGALTDLFLENGIPVVPLQTSSFVQEQKGKLVVTNYDLIEDILAHGGVPLLGGDVIIADRRRTVIASADRLATEFARHFHSRRILFATDVNGVYEKFPGKAGERPLPLIRRKDLEHMTVLSQVKNNSRDVTGAMRGKLRSLLPLRNCTVTIFNGLLPNTLAEVLRGKRLGTSIVL